MIKNIFFDPASFKAVPDLDMHLYHNMYGKKVVFNEFLINEQVLPN